MKNPSRKDAIKKSKQQRKNSRQSKPEPTSHQTSPYGGDTPNVSETLDRGDANAKKARQSRNKSPTKATKPNSKGKQLFKGKNNGLVSAEGFGNIDVFDVDAATSGDSYSALTGVPEQSRKEATQAQMKLARQENALETRLQRAKTVRKGIAVAREEQNAVTDYVNLESDRVKTATAVVNYQESLVQYDIAESKLEESQEKLIQQQNLTSHTQRMTPLLAEEHSLNETRQELKNDGLRLDIEQGRNTIQRRQNEIDAEIITIDI